MGVFVTEHSCAYCDDWGCYGYRMPGPVNIIPPGKRGILWVCPAHRREGEERWRKGIRGT